MHARPLLRSLRPAAGRPQPRGGGSAPLKELSNKPAATQRLSDGNTPLTMKLLVVAVSVKVANLVMESVINGEDTSAV